MADQLQLRGGTTAQNNAFTGAPREVTVDTDLDVLVVHDGLTPGGFRQASSSSVTNSTIYFDDDTGAGSVANAYILSPKSNTRTPTLYADGLVLGFVAINTNTGPSTVNFAGLGVKNVKLAGGGDPSASQISGRVEVVYDLANDWFELRSEDMDSEQLKSVAASVATNSMTVQLNPGDVGYRSSTASDGTTTTIANGVLTLAIPAGATLGTTSAVESRIMIIAINSAGTTELAVANSEGSNVFNETGLITTVAISTLADSADAIYSETARAGVPYRVVGFVDSTQPVAGTWDTAPSLVQPAGGEALTPTPVTIPPSSLCVAWANINQTGTISIRDSFNVASISDLGTGSTRVVFDTPLNNNNYSATSTGGVFASISTNMRLTSVSDLSTTSCIIDCRRLDNNTAIDADYISLQVFQGE